MTKVAAITVPLAENFEFTYANDVDTSTKVLRLLRQQLDSTDLALIEELTITFDDGHVHTLKDPFLQGHEPDDLEKLVAVLTDIGVPYEVDYAEDFVTIQADASDKYVTVVFENGEYSFSN